jgi:predicted DNA-binding protein
VVLAALLAWAGCAEPCLVRNILEVNSWLKNLEDYKLAVAAIRDLFLR